MALSATLVIAARQRLGAWGSARERAFGTAREIASRGAATRALGCHGTTVALLLLRCRTHATLSCRWHCCQANTLSPRDRRISRECTLATNLDGRFAGSDGGHTKAACRTVHCTTCLRPPLHIVADRCCCRSSTESSYQARSTVDMDQDDRF